MATCSLPSRASAATHDAHPVGGTPRARGGRAADTVHQRRRDARLARRPDVLAARWQRDVPLGKVALVSRREVDSYPYADVQSAR